MIELRNYQKHAIESLKVKVENVLRSPETGVVIFQAPTGSGKTVMVSELLKDLVENQRDDRKFALIWVSVRMLHEQSKEKLEKYYEDDRLLQCSYFEDLIDLRIGENEILFINWHSINKKDINIYVRENEPKYFAVIRTDGNAFYPDWIVQFNDGSIGIFDTKSGRTAEPSDAGPRAEGLQKYIKEENKKGKKLWGGIVFFVNGSWRYNDNDVYHYDPNNLSSWKLLSI